MRDARCFFLLVWTLPTLGCLDLDFEKYMVVDPKFYRPAEVDILLADPKKAKEKLNWEPEMKFKDLIESMVKFDYESLKGKIS